MPPGFMKATTAPPKSDGAVDGELRVGDHVAERRLACGDTTSSRVMSAVIEPTMRFAIGAAIALYFAIDRGLVRVLRTSRVTITLSGRDGLHVLRLVVDREVDVRDHERPNEDALVTSRAAEVADVRLVRVRADDEVDLRIERHRRSA